MATNKKLDAVISLLESLPEHLQDRVLEHICDYVEEIQDDQNWADSFVKDQKKLVAAVKKAKEEIQNGKSEPMDLKKL